MLEIHELRKRYGSTVALDGTSFSAPPGRMVGFLGPNGAGKTTTMRAIFGLARPDSGRIAWRGAPVGPADRLRFGYMPEQRGLYPRMKVVDQLVYFAQHHGLGRSTAKSAAARWLERLGIADRAGARVDQLSHGNQQRVQLAVALVHDPELLVLDEPFSGLDPIGIATMSEVLRERIAAGVGVVFSSHQLDLVEDLVEDVVIIARGRVVAAGAMTDLRAAAGRRHLEIDVEGGDLTWIDGLPDAVVTDRRGDSVQLVVADSVDIGAILERAGRVGTVRRVRFEPPALSEIFLHAVGTDGAGTQEVYP